MNPGPAGLESLSAREREVLARMAEGWSDAAIAGRLAASPRTQEAHIRQIQLRLHLPESPHDHRRLLADLNYLQTIE